MTFDALGAYGILDYFFLGLGFAVVVGLGVVGLMGAQALGGRSVSSPTSCSECGFNGSSINDEQSLELLAELPDWWAAVILGMDNTDLLRRPLSSEWSMAEYTDHARETAFTMRFLLQTALTTTDVDLGRSKEPQFSATPKPLSVAVSLDGLRNEIDQFVGALDAAPQQSWSSSVIYDNERVDVRWIARYLIHEVTHHLGDIQRLKEAMA